MCYSVHIPNKTQLTMLPVTYRRDNAAWVALRACQQWEKGITAEEQKAVFGLTRKPTALQLQAAELGGRAYPKNFVPVVVREDGTIWLRPMRYSVRPAGSPTELANKYQMFNARLDTLVEKRTWKRLVGRHHGLLPFTGFYEWVRDDEGNALELQFTPQGKDIMWAPVIWDHWKSLGGEVEFDSCALITDDPPPEVAQAGHDRCPIFLSGDAVDEWLSPELHKPDTWQKFLQGHREQVYYEHRKAA